MVRMWAYDFPEKFVAFATDLFEKDAGVMAGERTHSVHKVRPSTDLRNAAPPPGFNHADWIVAASIRESLNTVFNYTPSEGIFQIKAFTWPGDPEKQFRALGYTRIRGRFTPASVQGYKSLNDASNLYSAGWRVVMLINARLITNKIATENGRPATLGDKTAGFFGEIPNHYVGLNSAIVSKITSGEPVLHPFKIWSWGQSIVVSDKGCPISLSTVIGNYFGYVAGKF